MTVTSHTAPSCVICGRNTTQGHWRPRLPYPGDQWAPEGSGWRYLCHDQVCHRWAAPPHAVLWYK